MYSSKHTSILPVKKCYSTMIHWCFDIDSSSFSLTKILSTLSKIQISLLPNIRAVLTLLEREEEVAEQVLERRALIRVEKRIQRNIEEKKENQEPLNIKIRKTSRLSNIHHPQVLASTPNTPRLQKEDYKTLNYIFNIKYLRIPYDFGDERTFFCEVIIPIPKTFSIRNKNMTFKWRGKKSEES
ncbi:hypothetical protein K501DRAFT_266024 [Backusella circina FSU 941]|nr:hypothetical protein K501DRAFT_266024 [Backusella circina FSU 941]